ncbi:hypothetical protein [Croceicoccus pelagius]|nr:hypothetical protein [Croceicoccus pelagius]
MRNLLPATMQRLFDEMSDDALIMDLAADLHRAAPAIERLRC